MLTQVPIPTETKGHNQTAESVACLHPLILIS